MSFTKIKNFILQNRNSLLFLVLLFSFSFPNFAFAAEGETDFISIINGVFAVMGVLLGLLTQFVGVFLTPEWSSGSAIGFGTQLKDLWILMSNVVYTIFAIILIVIAFMNIIGKGENTWELKQAIPKFIVGVLIVPFSWFIVQAFIGLSSILTVSVLTIPNETFKDFYSNKVSEEFKICDHYKYNLVGGRIDKAGKKWETESQATESNEDIDFAGGSSLPPIECIGLEKTISENIEEGDNIFGIMALYTYGVMKVDTNARVFKETKIKSTSELIGKLGFDLLFFIVFFILMIALMMALFVRGIYLWIFTVMAPLFGLLYFFGDKTPESLKNFTFGKFLGLVMMPVYVAAALSFGLLFISVAGENISDTKCTSDTKNGLCIEEGGTTINAIITKITINGDFGSSAKDIQEGLSGLHGAFGQLILQIFGLVVMWIAIMAALKSSELTQEVIKPIESFGDSVGQLAMKAPSYAPIIPSPGGGTMSASALGTFGSTTAGNIDSHFRGKGSDLSNKLFGEGSPLVKAINNWDVNKSKISNSAISKEDYRKVVLPGLGALLKSDKQSEVDLAIKKAIELGILKKDTKIKISDTNKIKTLFDNTTGQFRTQAVINDKNILQGAIASYNTSSGNQDGDSSNDNSTNTFNVNMNGVSHTQFDNKEYKQVPGGKTKEEVSQSLAEQIINANDEIRDSILTRKQVEDTLNEYIIGSLLQSVLDDIDKTNKFKDTSE